MGFAARKSYDAERQIATGVRTGWVALATFFGLVALSLILIGALKHAIDGADDLVRSDERQLVQRFLMRSLESEAVENSGLFKWDDAVIHAQLLDSPWLDREFGDYSLESHEKHRSFLVASDGRLLRSWKDGVPTGDSSYQQVRWSVEALIARSAQTGQVLGSIAGYRTLADHVRWPIGRDGLMLPRWAGGLVGVEGRPQLVTVATIVPDLDARLLNRSPAYFVTMQPLDQAAIVGMRRNLVMSDLVVSAAGPAAHAENAIPLTGVDGARLGWLVWHAKSPGPTILRRAAPMLWVWLLFFVGVVVGGGVILRRMWRVTRELLVSEAQARHNALHDGMSGLPNRMYYMQRLHEELARHLAGEVRGDVFVAYLDLDGFKGVNDALGHHVGDELVRQVAMRLRHVLPAGDFIARFGGDEFVLMRCAEGGRAQADAFGQDVMTLMREPFLVVGHTIEVTCSCGISWGPSHSEDPGELLRRADIALYRAKQLGRARYRRFTRDMDASVKLRSELEVELRRAIARDELTMAYQPIVNVGDERIVGVEALLRWNHPERGAIRPDLFIPIAEQSGLMTVLGTWMLRRVFTECRDWPTCDISVNLSPLQIMAGNFVATMAGLVEETGIDPRRVVLEVTEGMMLDRSEHVATMLGELNAMGFRIALDDFGIGYSSLSYLRSFQFERIKIDRSFVSNIESDTDAHAILCTIASLGRSLRMKVVAEGVETDSQLQLVQAAGCGLVQGYLFWKAMPGNEARNLLVDQLAEAERVTARTWIAKG